MVFDSVFCLVAGLGSDWYPLCVFVLVTRDVSETFGLTVTLMLSVFQLTFNVGLGLIQSNDDFHSCKRYPKFILGLRGL